MMEAAESSGTAGLLGIADHIQGEAFLDVVLGTNAIDGFLHLAVTAIAAFYGIGRGRQQAVIQKGQRFLQVRRLEFS